MELVGATYFGFTCGKEFLVDLVLAHLSTPRPHVMMGCATHETHTCFKEDIYCTHVHAPYGPQYYFLEEVMKHSPREIILLFSHPCILVSTLSEPF